MDTSFSAVLLLLLDLQSVTAIKVASLTLLVFDTIITLDQEHEYVWQRHWNAVKILYLFIRYSTFIDTVIAVYERFSPNFGCSQATTFTTIFAGLGISLTELLLMIRTYGMYNSSRRILFFFIVMWLAIGGVNFWAVTKWTASFEFDVKKLVPPGTLSASVQESLQCYYGSTSLISLVCYLSLLVGESVILMMTLFRSFVLWQTALTEGRTNLHLVNWFHKEGIFFYIFILPFTAINAAALFAFPDVGLRFIADTPLRVAHTLLACRLVLHARKVADWEVTAGPDPASCNKPPIQQPMYKEQIGHQMA